MQERGMGMKKIDEIMLRILAYVAGIVGLLMLIVMLIMITSVWLCLDLVPVSTTAAWCY